MVDGSDAAVIQSIKAWEPMDRRLIVLSNIQPALDSSVDSISRNFTIAQLASSEIIHQKMISEFPTNSNK